MIDPYRQLTGRQHIPAPWLTLLLLVTLFAAGCTESREEAAPEPSAPAATAEANDGLSTPSSPTPTPTRRVTSEPQRSPRATPTPIPWSPTSEPGSTARDANLEALILRTLGKDSQSYGVVVRNLTTGTEAMVNPGRVFYAASLYKLPILYEMYRLRELGLLDFDSELELTAYYVEQDEGTLSLLDWEEGDTVSVREAVEAMIRVSDNASAWMLRDLVGWGLIDADMTKLGLRDTSVDSRELTTSAHDMATLLEIMARGQAVTPAASREMVELLAQQTVRDRIPALLPPDTRAANKTGNWLGATHDVAIVYAPGTTYVIAILSDKSWEPEPIAWLSLAVYDYFQTHGGR